MATTDPNQPNNPAQPAALPTASPVGIMDWKSKLTQGNANAQTRNVGQAETVNKQLTDLTAGNSRYVNTARQNAMTNASRVGMMTSSMAGGAAEKAAIESALPIAQQDASTYSRVASENTAAVNQDRLADQALHGQLTGQEMGVRANLDEAERARGFQSGERVAAQQYQTGERTSTQQFQSGERAATQQFQSGEREAAQAYDNAKQLLDQRFTGSEAEKARAQQRFEAFNNSMLSFNSQLSQTLASIYSNTSLKADQQNAAAANARSVYASLMNSYAASMAGGVPEIFWSPYQMSGPSAGAPTPAPAPAPTPSPAPTPTPSPYPTRNYSYPYSGITR